MEWNRTFILPFSLSLPFQNSTFALGYPPDALPPALIAFARLLNLSENDWEKTVEKGKVPKPKIDFETDGLEVVEILKAVMKMRLKEYRGSLEVRVMSSLPYSEYHADTFLFAGRPYCSRATFNGSPTFAHVSCSRVTDWRTESRSHCSRSTGGDATNSREKEGGKERRGWSEEASTVKSWVKGHISLFVHGRHDAYTPPYKRLLYTPRPVGYPLSFNIPPSATVYLSINILNRLLFNGFFWIAGLKNNVVSACVLGLDRIKSLKALTDMASAKSCSSSAG